MKPILLKPPLVSFPDGSVKPLDELTNEERELLAEEIGKSISQTLSEYFTDLQYNK